MHTPPAWTASARSTRRLVLTVIAVVIPVAALALTACTGVDPNPAVFAEDCQSCHIQEFLTVSEPVHVDVYPERCVACHSSVSWRPDDNTGHEAIFPVSGTEHDGLTCDECHPEPARTLDFTCTECHAHERADMDDEHGGEDGYRYESSACLDCHPDGGE